jgi:elongation factor G
VSNRNEVIHGLLFCPVQSAPDEDRPGLVSRLEALLGEDPELRIEVGTRRDAIVLLGDDELEIELARERIRASSDLVIGEAQVDYRETVSRTAEGEGKYIRETGGSGNYGHAKVRIEPNEPDKGYEFIDDIKGGVVPKEYIKPIDQGIRGALELGILAGFPVVDVKVHLFDGSYHEVDSNEMAFKFAGSMAFKDAAKKASPVVLEPVMAVEVTVPEELMGAVIGDINSRRGRIDGIDNNAGLQEITAVVPLVETLRASANGPLDYAMHFAGYEPRPRGQNPFSDDAPAGVRNPSAPLPRTGSAAAEFDV